MFKYLTKNKGELTLTLAVSGLAVCGYVGWSFLLQLVVDIATGKRAGNLVALAGCFIVYMIVMDSLGGLDQFLRPRLKWHAAKRARAALMGHAFAESPADFAQVGVGTMIGKLTKQLDNVTQNFFGEALWLFQISVQMLVATMATLAISPLVTGLIFLLSIPALVFPFLLKKVLSKASDEQVAAIDAYAAKATDLLSGFSTLKYALAGPAAKRQHEQLNVELYNAQTRNSRLAAISFAISALLNDITYMAAWFLGAVMVQRGQMDMGQMVVFSNLTGYLTFPMMSLTQDIPTMIGGARAAKQLDTFIEAPVAAAAGTAQPQVATPIAVLNQAGFSAAGRAVLADLDLTLIPGQKVLVVGASGSGKTTLVRLLLGELAPTAGDATLFGVSATALARQATYAHIGLMTQAGHVFTGTVRENLSLFSDAYPDEAMVAALQRAGLGSWLAAHSLDTTVGADDPTLSGGEQQRIALARLFLRGADYYIFDELTTGLDPHIAAELLRDLFAMPQGFLMITHTYNAAAFAQADTILVLDAGRIVARGPVTTPAVRSALQGLELVAAD